MVFHSHLNSAVSILETYKGSEPFHLYLKKYFSQNKKYGSKDRKQITSLCYNYFRLGHAANNLPVEERILVGTFLTGNKPSELLQFSKPGWNAIIDQPLENKIAFLHNQFSIKNNFPFKDDLSEGIDPGKFSLSFLFQPKLFLRIRPGFKNTVSKKLAAASISYEFLSENCIALPNSAKIDSVVELDKEAVVQDYNSQRVAEFLQPQTSNFKPQTVLWDCCAASGGKSIMAYDINPYIQLTVSDKRESILQNLHKRFEKAGIRKYHSFVADLSVDQKVSNVQTAFGVQTGNAVPTGKLQTVPTASSVQIGTPNFDFIIADVPCTGSGTWARTPEQLYFFDKKEIKRYSNLQKQIVQNVIPFLKPGGHLLYITCSVFKKENEEVVDLIKENHLKLLKMELLKGYEMQADTLFAALFKK